MTVHTHTHENIYDIKMTRSGGWKENEFSLFSLSKVKEKI